jgi:uncharacterized membrane protein YkoI
MKTVSLFIAAIGFAFMSCGQDIPESKIPSVVLNAVKAKYPGASDIDWEKKKDFYEAEFDMDSTEHEFHIDANGKIIEHKREISLSELPAAVQNVLKSGYPGHGIGEVDMIEKQGQVFYELELEAKGQKDKKVTFSSDGKLIS